MQRTTHIHPMHADTFAYRGLVYSGRWVRQCHSNQHPMANYSMWPLHCPLECSHPPQQPVKLIGVYEINSTCVKMQQVKVTTHIQSLKGVLRTLPHIGTLTNTTNLQFTKCIQYSTTFSHGYCHYAHTHTMSVCTWGRVTTR